MIFLCQSSYSQPWVEMTKKEHPNFFEIQKAYSEYATTREANFKGSKQYKRWEWFFESRVNEDGRVPADIYWNETQKLNSNHNTNGRSYADWQPLGPTEIPLELGSGFRIGVGRINCIEFHPSDPDTYWIGAPVGGVWKTTDDGATWSTTTDELLSIGIGDIVVNPLDPDVIYIATGDRDGPDIFSVGILKSIDGGQTWHTTGLNFTIPDLTNVNEIVINPNDTSVLVAATSVGMFKTTDGGITWNPTSDFRNFKDMVCQHDNFNVMITSTFDRSTGFTKVYRSTDAGDTWVLNSQFSAMLYDASRTAFGTSAADPNVIYAVTSKIGSENMQGLYKSNDAGITWSKISDAHTPDLVEYLYPEYPSGYGQGWFDLTLEVSPTNVNDILVGATHMWRSVDGGDVWLMIQEFNPSPTWIHVDFHEFRYHPYVDKVFACCDGGIYSSTNNGVNWEDISAGVQVLQSYRIGVSETIENYVVMGNQDNGSMRLMDSVVSAINSSDGTECFIDYESPEIAYTSMIFGDLYRSANYGLTWVQVSPPGQVGTGAWLTPFTLCPNDPTILYGGYYALWKSDNRGSPGSWSQISNSIPGKIHRIDICADNDSVIYICSHSLIYRTKDGGENWSYISSDLPEGFISDIEVSPVDEDVLWVTFGRFNEDRRVFVTRDGGENWKNITYNLPNLPVNCVAYDKNTCDGVYIGNDAGVYYLNNSMDEWTEFSSGLPNVIVADLEIQYEFNSVVVGTYGRGLWNSVSYITDEDPVADFKVEFSEDYCWDVTFMNTTSAYFDSVYWNLGDGNTSIKLNPNHVYTQSGSYDVTLTVYKNEIEYSITKQIQIQEIPVADFTFDLQEYTVAFYNESENGSSYLWDFGDGNQSTDQDPVHTYQVFDDYQVKLNTYNDICKDSITKSILLVSLESNEEIQYFRIYPNPSEGLLTMEVGPKIANEFEVEIANSRGTIVYKNNYINKDTENGITIDLRHLSGGIYVLKILINEKSYSRKIIIE